MNTTFNPNAYMIRVQGNREYLPVAARVIWFHAEKPEWSIHTEIVVNDFSNKFAIVRASIIDEKGVIRAQGTKKEDAAGFPDFLEKAETGAIGRALALCGFGTQFAPDLDENGDVCDSPREPRAAAPAQRPPQQDASPEQLLKTKILNWTRTADDVKKRQVSEYSKSRNYPWKIVEQNLAQLQDIDAFIYRLESGK